MNACLINGQAITSLSISDRAIHYGDGIFETIALKHGVMPFWSDHYQRLMSACERLKFPVPSEGILLQEIDVVKQNQETAVIKIIITRGTNEWGYRIPNVSKTKRIVQSYSFPQYPSTYYQQGIKVVFCKTPVSENSALAGIKHLNRLDNVLASSEWNDADIAEGLMCNAQQYVIQGTKSNVFCVRDGVLYTPDLTQAGILGVMRAQILNWAQQRAIPVRIQPITREAFLAADEVFISNSIFGVWPVTDIEGHVFPIGKYTRELLTHFE